MKRPRDEDFVVDLCDEILGETASRQHRFDWLRGDPGKDGRGRMLPVDAYYFRAGLVVEYHEIQHRIPVAHFDKPDRLTVSGMHRGEQRRRYDERRERTIAKRPGLALVVIRSDQLDCDSRGRLRRNVENDREVLIRLLGGRDG